MSEGVETGRRGLESVVGTDKVDDVKAWLREVLQLDLRAGSAGELDEHFLWHPIYGTMPYPGELEYHLTDLAVGAALGAIRDRLLS